MPAYASAGESAVVAFDYEQPSAGVSYLTQNVLCAALVTVDPHSELGL